MASKSHKAPGKSHREGLTFLQVADMFSTDEAAIAWLAEQRWPRGPYCPRCGTTNVQSNIKHKTMTHRCRECVTGKSKTMFSLKTGSVMEGSKISYRHWAIAIYLFMTNIKGVSSMRLHRELGIGQKAAWFMLQRLRKALEADIDPLFEGPVEADETYIGGKRKNMSNAKRRELKDTGRGGVGKAVVVGVKDRKTGQVIARHVLQVDTLDVAGFVDEMTAWGAVVYTDEAKVYNVLASLYRHETVKHSVSEYVRGQAHTNGIESFWAMLKRGFHGTYHKMSPKHLDLYISEFAGRHNIRELDTIDQMRLVAQGMRGKRLRYADLIADNGLESGARAA